MKNVWFFILFTFYIKSTIAQSNASCNIFYQYKCGNKFNRYKLDNEPADYGVSAGQYASGKEAYIGLSTYADLAYQINQLQLNPPGVVLFNTAGPASFSNDTNRIWYLVNDKNHEYTWVDSKNAEIPSFAIKVGEDRSGFPLLIGRVVRPNGFVSVGVVVPFAGNMFYADENGLSQSTTTGYQVLVCKSSVQNETKFLTPKADFPPNVDVGCINNWQPYKNDESPVKNGVSAGEYDCNNTAYVGKINDTNQGVYVPGRIQISPKSGLIFTSNGQTFFNTNASYYLVDNLNHTYYWVPFDGNTLPNNTVYVRNEVGSWKYGIGRIKVNGHTEIGKIAYPLMFIPDNMGYESAYTDYEVLVCIPEPKFQCGQHWTRYEKNSAPEKDGFNIGTINGSISVFIGRSCNFDLGRIQTNPQTAAGLYYANEITGTEVFDNSSNVEYFVKNSSYTYKWQPSSDGVKVANALELHKEGYQPFYIGMTRIDDNVVVGKVRPGEGLFFIDPLTEKQQLTSSYEVLTCTSPDSSYGEYEEESDEDWYGDHWCPMGKKWSYEKTKCV
ncbi:hypothetical protein PVAND_002959 [Polypedilum vanderplanki]|uniref:Uncharacterized protein n=1 Tax=Polypedilum vanderplanki TaxID=319348 RepID=A0A9J6BSP7_POLVA|nr:hypothetical protein PVAND_002959 [Polypedilum vanderplanki]